MTITDKHWLEGVARDEIAGGAAMAIRRCLVMHFTAGATGRSSIESMRRNGLSAHLVIERDGTVIQCRAFNVECAHAGRSRWQDPKTGRIYQGANGFSIGIEIANAGNDAGALGWARKQAGFSSMRASHRNGGPVAEWECYPAAQMAAVTECAKALVAHYHLDDITGHDCIAPERKDDPGPAFGMVAVREACGFAGLPAVHRARA